MAIHSGILAWKIWWTEEPGGLESMGLQRVEHNWATNTHICWCFPVLSSLALLSLLSSIPIQSIIFGPLSLGVCLPDFSSSHTTIEIKKKKISPIILIPFLPSFPHLCKMEPSLIQSLGTKTGDSGPDSSPYTPQKYISNCVFCSLANSTTSHHSPWCQLDLPLYFAFPQQRLTWFSSFPSCPIPLCLGSLFSTEQLESFSKF